MDLSNFKMTKKLGFGLMRLPQTDPDDYASPIDREKVNRMVDAMMAGGFNYFDTAYVYNDGDSEKAFRDSVVARYPRESFTITDKLPVFAMNTKADMERIMGEMLENCGVDYLDYLWLHALSDATYDKAVHTLDGFNYLRQMKKEGKALHIGFSFHGSPAMLDRILTEQPDMEVVQLQINYLDWEDRTVEAHKCYDVCVKHGKPVVVMEPVKGGSLANLPAEAARLFEEKAPGKSAASWAIRFAASHENILTVLSGMSNEEQVMDNIATMQDFVPLTDEEKSLTQRAAANIRKDIAIPCTACRYCTSGCPMQIVIPDYFTIYNNIKKFGETAMTDVYNYYNNLIQIHGAPGDCIKCGLCEEHCPQHLPIRDLLEEVKAAIEGA